MPSPNLGGVSYDWNGSSTANVVLPVPSDVEDGDFLVAHLTGGGPTTWSENGTSDFTEEVDEFTTTGVARTSFALFVQEVADAGALPGSYTFTQSPTRSIIGALYVVKGADSYDVGTPVVKEAGGDPLVIPGVTAEADDLVLALAGKRESNNGWWPTDDDWSSFVALEAGNSELIGAFQSYDSGQATGTITYDGPFAAQSIGVAVAFHSDGVGDNPRVVRGLRSVSSATATHTVDVPTHVEGDVLVVAGGVDNASNPVTAPGGWAELVNDVEGSPGVSGGVWWREASDAEPGSYDWTSTGTPDGSFTMFVLRGVDPDTSPVAATSQGTGTSVVLTGVTATDPGLLFAAVMKASGKHEETPDNIYAGYDLFGDARTSNGFENLAAAGATGTRTFEWSDSGAFVGGLVAFALASVSPVTVDTEAARVAVRAAVTTVDAGSTTVDTEAARLGLRAATTSVDAGGTTINTDAGRIRLRSATTTIVLGTTVVDTTAGRIRLRAAETGVEVGALTVDTQAAQITVRAGATSVLNGVQFVPVVACTLASVGVACATDAVGIVAATTSINVECN